MAEPAAQPGSAWDKPLFGDPAAAASLGVSKVAALKPDQQWAAALKPTSKVQPLLGDGTFADLQIKCQGWATRVSKSDITQHTLYFQKQKKGPVVLPDDFPGGPKGLEDCLKCCLSGSFNLTHRNAAVIQAAAAFLHMTKLQKMAAAKLDPVTTGNRKLADQRLALDIVSGALDYCLLDDCKLLPGWDEGVRQLVASGPENLAGLTGFLNLPCELFVSIVTAACKQGVKGHGKRGSVADDDDVGPSPRKRNRSRGSGSLGGDGLDELVSSMEVSSDKRSSRHEGPRKPHLLADYVLHNQDHLEEAGFVLVLNAMEPCRPALGAPEPATAVRLLTAAVRLSMNEKVADVDALDMNSMAFDSGHDGQLIGNDGREARNGSTTPERNGHQNGECFTMSAPKHGGQSGGALRPLGPFSAAISACHNMLAELIVPNMDSSDPESLADLPLESMAGVMACFLRSNKRKQDISFARELLKSYLERWGQDIDQPSSVLEDVACRLNDVAVDIHKLGKADAIANALEDVAGSRPLVVWGPEFLGPRSMSNLGDSLGGSLPQPRASLKHLADTTVSNAEIDGLLTNAYVGKFPGECRFIIPNVVKTLQPENYCRLGLNARSSGDSADYAFLWGFEGMLPPKDPPRHRPLPSQPANGAAVHSDPHPRKTNSLEELRFATNAVFGLPFHGLDDRFGISPSLESMGSAGSLNPVLDPVGAGLGSLRSRHDPISVDDSSPPSPFDIGSPRGSSEGEEGDGSEDESGGHNGNKIAADYEFVNDDSEGDDAGGDEMDDDGPPHYRGPSPKEPRSHPVPVRMYQGPGQKPLLAHMCCRLSLTEQGQHLVPWFSLDGPREAYPFEIKGDSMQLVHPEKQDPAIDHVEGGLKGGRYHVMNNSTNAFCWRRAYVWSNVLEKKYIDPEEDQLIVHLKFVASKKIVCREANDQGQGAASEDDLEY